MHLFLPFYYSKQRKTNWEFLTEENVYENYWTCVRKAISTLISQDELHTWPTSYEAEKARLNKDSGARMTSTRLISNAVAFGRALMAQVKSRYWGKDAFILTTTRGVKELTRHEPQQTVAPDDLESLLPLERIPEINFVQLKDQVEDQLAVVYLDVAMEFWLPERSAFTRENARPRMLRYLFPEWSEADCETRTRRDYSNIEVDVNAQLSDIAGWRYVVCCSCFLPTANQ